MGAREEKRKRHSSRGKRQRYIFRSALLLCLFFGLLAAVWHIGRATVEAGFDLKPGGNGKYQFHVVEVVPEKTMSGGSAVSPAVLGFYMAGNENINRSHIANTIVSPDGSYDPKYQKLFYKGGTGKEPLYIQAASGRAVVDSNDVFLLWMLGICEYDNNLSLRENYEKNRETLDLYELTYDVVTPGELEAGLNSGRFNLNAIHYLHINSGEQLSGMKTLYQEVYGNAAQPVWEDGFPVDPGNPAANDISWGTALQIYQRAIAEEGRMAVSVSSSAMWGSRTSKSSNLYKLYEMLNYVDDPSQFQRWIRSPQGGEAGAYVNLTDGRIYLEGDTVGKDSWSDDLLGKLPTAVLTDTSVAGPGSSRRAKTSHIPGARNNILIFNDASGGSRKPYFDREENVWAIHQILNYTSPGSGGDIPADLDDGKVRVLEIEPCNSYWLDQDENLGKLARALQVKEEDISVTYVTPGRLNGMAVDLAAEYDVLFVGDDVSQFRENSGYRKTLPDGSQVIHPYRHNGYAEDRVIPQTLLNGLLAGDYMTETEVNDQLAGIGAGTSLNIHSVPGLEGSTSKFWNPGLREQWAGAPNRYFLKNVGLFLEFQQRLGKPGNVSLARFSGNDVTRYMQRQIARFVNSGQPVVAAETVVDEAFAMWNDIALKDMENRPPEGAAAAEPAQDARIYLGLLGVEDLDYEGALPGTVNPGDLYRREDLDSGTSPIELLKEHKPVVEILNAGEEAGESGENAVTIMRKGSTEHQLWDLARSNRLVFDFRVRIPDGTADQTVMTVVVDRNGDGIFDEMGEGEHETKDQGGNVKKGEQNNAAETIRNDLVFEYKFSEKVRGTDYEVDGDMLTGSFFSPGMVDSIEEYCQFRVIVSTRDGFEKLRGVWTGYMRPAMEQRTVRILQITPYSDSAGSKPLSEIYRFRNQRDSLEKTMRNEDGTFAGEFVIDLERGLEDMNEADFAARCQSQSITAESLRNDYDLILVGTDFTQEAAGDRADIHEERAAEVLRTYTDVLKGPIIFTNDSISYENSENYVTAVESRYEYRDMTLTEAEQNQAELAQYRSAYEQGRPLPGDRFRRVEISGRNYYGYQQKRRRLTEINGSDYKGEGTAYLEPEQGTNIRQVGDNEYRALLFPLNAEGRKGSEDIYVDRQTIDGNGSPQYNWLTLRSTDGGDYLLAPSRLGELVPGFFKLEYPAQPGQEDYYLKLRCVTELELAEIYQNADQSRRTVTLTATNSATDAEEMKEFYYYEELLHSGFFDYAPIPQGSVLAPASITIPGFDLCTFNAEDGSRYLAAKIQPGQESYGYVWQIREEGKASRYELAPVAGEPGALYPEKNSWNYYLTQSMRDVLGMDRFAVTTAQKDEEKRDKGSSRRWTGIEEIQGFTDAALLEFAYLLPPDSPGDAVAQDSQYSDPLLKLGTRPRTDAVEPVNEGTIGRYPFDLTVLAGEGGKLPVTPGHAPYYQLDLDRETGEGKIDDVTVWYTLAGSDASEYQEESQYFNVTRRDAVNNYYLYSKGKAYYTGFSLYEDEDGPGGDAVDPATDMEMKLFINTIYAALSGGPAGQTDSPREILVKEEGNVSCLARSRLADSYNRYTCYYEEEDAELELFLRVQKSRAPEGDTVPLALAWKERKEEGGGIKLTPLKTDYKFDAVDPANFPVSAPPPQNDGVEGTWYRLVIPLDQGSSSLTRESADGRTLIIGIRDGKETDGGVILDNSAIHAEIQFVMRNLFDLD